MSAYHPNLPHGAGLILISLGYYGKLIEKGASPERFINMAKALGYDKGDAAKPEDFLEALAELQKKCKVDTLKTSDFGIKRDEFPMFANNARETMGNLFDVTPVELTHDDCVAIFESTK
jgi:alcohol dehydrogenase